MKHCLVFTEEKKVSFFKNKICLERIIQNKCNFQREIKYILESQSAGKDDTEPMNSNVSTVIMKALEENGMKNAHKRISYSKVTLNLMKKGMNMQI